MSVIETEQVRLRLTEKEDILDQLKQNKRIAKGVKGRWEYRIQFDGVTFYFYPGEVRIVGRNVANALKRDSAVIMGDHLSGDISYAIEEIGHYDMLTGGMSGQRQGATTCGVCNEIFETIPQLLHHMKQHEKDHPELFLTPEEALVADQRPIVTNPETGRKERGSLPVVDIR